jgi:hypothetical protein
MLQIISSCSHGHMLQIISSCSHCVCIAPHTCDLWCLPSRMCACAEFIPFVLQMLYASQRLQHHQTHNLLMRPTRQILRHASYEDAALQGAIARAVVQL